MKMYERKVEKKRALGGLEPLKVCNCRRPHAFQLETYRKTDAKILYQQIWLWHNR